jgi:hypothetical protein
MNYKSEIKKGIELSNSMNKKAEEMAIKYGDEFTHNGYLDFGQFSFQIKNDLELEGLPFNNDVVMILEDMNDDNIFCSKGYYHQSDLDLAKANILDWFNNLKESK